MVSILTPELGEVPVFEKTLPPLSSWRDGVVVRTPNWLGDAVMAIPAILRLKEILPEFCGLFVLAPKGIAPLFEALPFIDEVMRIENPHAFLSKRERDVVRRMHAGIGILFNNSFRDALSLRLAGVPDLYGSDARFRRSLLKRAYEFPPRRDFFFNKPHQAAKYLSIVESLGAEPWDGVFPEFEETLSPEILPEVLEKVLAGNPRILAVAAGAAYGDAKRWAPENFRAVCRARLEEGWRIVMLGSSGERPAAEEIIRGLSPAGETFNLAGETTLDELIYLLRKSAFCLANDSGVMHLAAALGVPGTAPFGPTDPIATCPLSKRWRIVFEKCACSPCFKRVCPLGTKACFNAVTPEEVLRAMDGVPLD